MSTDHRSKRRRQAQRPTMQPQRGSAGQFRQLDFAVEARALRRWPSISACMIVKNEAENLRPCLESLADLASEIIVVDTGSSDDTVQIAQEMGAKVFHFPWIDDFAAARNESIAHATREWVFWLDADDRLDPKAVAQLKNAAASGKADAYMCMVCSREPDGKQTVTEHTRLFRNGLGIRFTGAIHEGILRDLVQLGLRVARTDVALTHAGYGSPESIQLKTERNLAIIELELAAGPDRIDLVFYRGHARSSLGDVAGAKSDMMDYLARTSPDSRFNHMRFWAYSVLARLQQGLEERAAAAGTLASAMAEFPGHPHFLHLSANQHLIQGRTEEALGELRAAWEALGENVRGFRPPEWWIEGRLAQGYRHAGNKEEALLWAERASAHAPDSAEAGMLLARLYLETGRLAQAEAAASSLSRTVATAEPWLILTEALHNQGRWGEADEALREAQSRGVPEADIEDLRGRMKAARILAGTRTEAGSSAGHLQAQMEGLAFLSKGDYARAAECLARAIEEEPSAPDSYKYLAVALQALGREDQAMEAWRLALQFQTEVSVQ